MAGIGLSLVVLLFVFGQFTPKKDSNAKKAEEPAAQMNAGFTADSALLSAKKTLPAELISEAENLEKQLRQSKDSISQLAANHELAHFWQDKGRLFEPYAWYEAEASRLENSEKSLTFAARLFLENLQEDSDGPRRQWKAMQAIESKMPPLKLSQKWLQLRQLHLRMRAPL